MFNDLFEHIYSMSMYELFNNFQYIGQGSGRVVFGINNQFAAKRAKTESGDKQCDKEYEIYNRADGYYRSYFCPIIWYKKGMVVMPRAIPLRLLIGKKEIDTERIRPGIDIYDDLKKISKRFGLYFTDLLSSSSWGIINNNLVLIDYGCTGLSML